MNTEKICFFSDNVDSATQYLAQCDPDFVKGLHDFCHAFGLKIDYVKPGSTLPDRVILLTKEGWPAGILSALKDSKGKYFTFKSPFVRKSRGSARSHRNERDSDKITGIITAIKRNNEIPTAKRGFESEHYAIQCAFSSIEMNRSEPRISLTSEAVLAAVQGMLGVDSPNVQAYREQVEEAYNSYIEKLNNAKSARGIQERFSEGSKLIGICQTGAYLNSTRYAVARIKRVDKKIELQGDVKVYATLADTEFAVDASIIRTYMEAKFPGEGNELRIPRADKFYEEIDVATGYSSSHFFWVLIPERGE